MSREYPERPIVSVGVVVVRGEEFLLVRRGRPPSQNLWSVPGGAVELGEIVSEAARREVREETGVECEPVDVHEVVDRVYRDDAGRVRYHYVILETLARWVSGEPRPSSDAADARWARMEDLRLLELTPGVDQVIARLLLRRPWLGDES